MNPKTRQSLSLSCDPSSINDLRLQCRSIRCRLGPMSWQALSAYVTFASSLLVGEDSIEEIFGDRLFEEIVYSVQLRATIIDEHLSGGSSAISSVATVQLTFKAVEPVSDEPVDWWIYLLGVLIGLLLIALLVLLLCKVSSPTNGLPVLIPLPLYQCGFFKRKGAAHLAAQEAENDEE